MINLHLPLGGVMNQFYTKDNMIFVPAHVVSIPPLTLARLALPNPSASLYLLKGPCLPSESAKLFLKHFPSPILTSTPNWISIRMFTKILYGKLQYKDG